MLINSKPEPITIDDYDLIFTGGFSIPISLDKAAGDSVVFEGSPPIAIRFNIVAKSNLLNPDVETGAEETTIYLSQLAAIKHRTREVLPLNPAQEQEFRTLLKLHDTIQ